MIKESKRERYLKSDKNNSDELYELHIAKILILILYWLHNLLTLNIYFLELKIIN